MIVLHADPIKAIKAMADTAAWRAVPSRVVQLLKTAGDIKKEVQKAMESLDVADPGYGYVYWHPQKNKLWAVLSDSDEQDSHDAWWKALSKIPGINKVITEAESGPNREHIDEWVLIKKARVFTKSSDINPFTTVGNAFGGPNAVTNSVVGALIGGGLGYGGGRIAEWLTPEKYVERGRLSRTMGLLGALAGGTPGMIQGFTHMDMNRDAGQPNAYRSWFKPTNDQAVSPGRAALMRHRYGPLPDSPFPETKSDFSPKLPAGNYFRVQESSSTTKPRKKTGMDTNSGFGNAAFRPIHVDRFNNVIWQDPHSPPAVNAAAVGIVSGIQQHYGGASVLSPKHFINGLAAAGVDYMTASVAGGVLGALGGLKPEAQQSLQQMGLWSGLMRGSIGSLLGQ